METKNIYDVTNSIICESLSNLHTSTIAKITKVETKTINCKPVFNRLVDGVEIQLPEFAEVPLVTQQGGDSYIHMPVSVGDYCLLILYSILSIRELVVQAVGCLRLPFPRLCCRGYS